MVSEGCSGGILSANGSSGGSVKGEALGFLSAKGLLL